MIRLAALLTSCALPAMAQDFSLAMPVDCVLDDTCYIQNYVDHDPGDGNRDFRCGTLSYDTHKGTDFGLPSLAAMEAGVDVLAAAAGTVRGVRDTMRDVLYSEETANEVAGRECGNGVVIVHGDGWETQYCHMAEESIVVLPGDFVEAGEVLGRIGLSGRTQFPHLHLSVRRDGQVVDPFDPDGVISCGAPSEDTLWAEPMSAPPGGIISSGFADGVPQYDDVKAGTAAAEVLTPNAPIVLWAFAFGAQPGDLLTIRFSGPEGALFATEDVLDRRQALVMRAGGLNVPDAGWPIGVYTGVVEHIRDGDTLDRQELSIMLERAN